METKQLRLHRMLGTKIKKPKVENTNESKMEEEEKITSNDNNNSKMELKEEKKKNSNDFDQDEIKSFRTFNKYVVHCKKSKYDVYIGRYNPSIKSASYEWGNPFVIGKDGDRNDVISKFQKYILENKEMVTKAKKELKGKILACWCAPELCHGNVLAKIANENEDLNT